LFFTLKENALKVYEEDFKVLESVQKALKNGSQIQKSGAYERLIIRMHKIYLKQMGFSLLKFKIILMDFVKIPNFLMVYFKKSQK
jgi:hypothetical protein